MIKLIAISKYELPELVQFSYEGDNDLWEKYHLEKFTKEQAVKSTMDLVNEHDRQIDLKYFKVVHNDTVIGYVITCGDFLYSFCINIEYRTKEILTEWWDEMIKEIGSNIKVGVNSNNTRAIRYFKNRGMKISWINPIEKDINEVLLTF